MIKNRRIVLSLMAAVVVCSCQANEEGELALEGKVFTATMESLVDESTGVDTKTSMDSRGNVRWKRGDQVSIFAGSTVNEHYQVTDASDGKTAAALNQVENAGFVSGGEISNNVAYYPYAATAEIAKNGNSYVISDIALPATQIYAEDSFGSGAFPMVAVTSSTRDYILKFKNVLGGLKVQLKGTATITSISITGNNNEKLCGSAEVTVSNTTVPVISLTDVSAKTVTLYCGDGVQLNESTSTAFIIALPSITMTDGFTVTVTDTEYKQMEIKTTKSQTITRSNLLSMPPVNYEGIYAGPQYVDLGLPSGLKWATSNVGAFAPEEYGDYYAWGETEPHYENGYAQSESPVWKEGKIGYNWTSYQFNLGTDWQGPFSKYCTDSEYGTVDNETALYPEDDAASVNWGSSWRIPTYAEWAELRAECSWSWTTRNGVDGYLVTGSNNNSIFLPAAGYRNDTRLNNPGSYGFYWSSSLSTDIPYSAWEVLFFGSDRVYSGGDNRSTGLSVRPVFDECERVSVTGVSINSDAVDLIIGYSTTLLATVSPSNSRQTAVKWSSSDNSVATVYADGTVAAISEGSATITATTYDGGFTATCAVTVSPFVPKSIDLGLTSGLKWATCNVGAFMPEEYGDYFAWGETDPYYEVGYSQSDDPIMKFGKSAGYTWASYKWCNGSETSLTKYCTSTSYGTVDNNTELDLDDDAARVNWGGNWRMPAIDEWAELISECTWTWTSQNGKIGCIVTGPNGNSIFLPNAGYWGGNYGTMGTMIFPRYWSSSLDTDSPSRAWNIDFTWGHVSRAGSYRYYGFPVRPVSDEDVRVPINLSAEETANTYIVSEPGYYSINATIAGNGKKVSWPSAFVSYAYPEYTSTGELKKFAGDGVEVILNQNNCVSNVSYINGKIRFKATGNEGNAKLTLTKGGEGVWTWLIWCTDAPAVRAVDADGYIYHIMDRNIGAISDGTDNANCEELSGLYYQYGNPIGYTYEAFYNQGYWGYEFNGRGIATQIYSLAHYPNKPTLNVTPGEGQDFYWFDLWYDGVPDKTLYGYLWGGGSAINGSLKFGDEVVKTLYDPCPAGYKIMGLDTFEGFNITDTFSANSNGVFIPVEDGDLFFPYNGAAWPNDADGTPFYMLRGPYHTVEGASMYSTLWLSGHVGRNVAYYNAFNAKSASTGVYEPCPSTGHIVARGFGVRCMADEFNYE